MSFHEEIAGLLAATSMRSHARDADALTKLWDEVGLFPTPTSNFAMEGSAFRERCCTPFAFYQSQGVMRPKSALISVDELFPGAHGVLHDGYG